MQVFSTLTSPVVTGLGVGTGASKYTDLITQYANTLANGSKASVDDQLNAYQNLQSLIFSGVDSGNGGVLYQTNKNDLSRAVDIYDSSHMSKRIQQVDAQFSATGLASAPSASDGSFNIAQNKLDNLARFSQDDQKIIFVAEEMNIPGALVVGGKSIYYASLDDWKADLKKQAAAFVAQPLVSGAAPSSSATNTAGTVVPGSVVGGQSTAKTAGNALVALLSKDGASGTDADAALQILLKFQAEMDAEKLTARTSASKNQTSGASSYTVSRTAATLQTNSSKATSSQPVGQLNLVA